MAHFDFVEIASIGRTFLTGKRNVVNRFCGKEKKY